MNVAYGCRSVNGDVFLYVDADEKNMAENVLLHAIQNHKLSLSVRDTGLVFWFTAPQKKKKK